MSLHTIVTLNNGGAARFDGCVADVFEGGKLTITATADDSEVALLDGWREAVVFDHNDQIAYALQPSRPS